MLEKLLALLKIRTKVDREAGSNVAADDSAGGDSEIDAETYDTMLDSDGLIRGLVNIFNATILSLNWTIEGGDNASRELVNNNFNNPAELGGMSVTVRKVITHMLKAFVYGWSPFEKVFTIYEAKIVLRKLAARNVHNYEILKDDKGGFNGLRQKEPEVDIGPENSFVFTLGDGLYGESPLKTLHPYWHRKQGLNRLDDLAAERYTVPPEVLNMPKNTTTTERTRTVREIQRKKFNAVIGVPGSKEEGYELKTLNPTITSNLDKIEWCNLEMARALGMTFYMIVNSSTGGGTGSYALSRDQSTLFAHRVRDVAAEIEEAINKYIIPQLVLLNLNTKELPRFKFAPIHDDKTLSFIEKLIGQTKSANLIKVLNQAAGSVLGEDIDIENDTILVGAGLESLENAINPEEEPLEPEPDEE